MSLEGEKPQRNRLSCTKCFASCVISERAEKSKIADVQWLFECFEISHTLLRFSDSFGLPNSFKFLHRSNEALTISEPLILSSNCPVHGFQLFIPPLLSQPPHGLCQCFYLVPMTCLGHPLQPSFTLSSVLDHQSTIPP
mmetsp:Transcript_2598/g.4616  ORF Transcript_2598/g.4616 Transcript_2598/m.4616 type:complete len:139 (+) Transcript_2598:164-580(+)